MMQRNVLSCAAAVVWTSALLAQSPNALQSTTRPTLTPPATRPSQSHSFTPFSELTPITKQAPSPMVSPSPAVEEELVSFDDRLADLQWSNGHYILAAGPDILKDFGRRETDARQALSLIRELHLNQHGTVGSPRAILEYWLSDGRPPTNSLPGLRVLPFDPASLHVEQVQGYWCVRDQRSTLFNFGSHKDEAARALGIIKRHGFDRLGLVGQGTPVMLVFLSPPPGMMATPLHAPPPPKGRIVTPRRMESAAPASNDLPPSMLQTSRIRTSGNMAQSSELNRMETKKGPSIGNDPSASAIPVGRQLAPPGGPSQDLSTLADRVPLDYHQARLFQDRLGWKLLCGNYVVASFGNEREARLADMAFRTSRFTEQCLIGHPKPAFSYFLVNGQPPRGLPLGARSVEFHPDALSVRQTKDGWTICELDRPLFVFGDKADEAKETLKAIQRHHFDAFCRLGQGEQAMTILARTR